MCQRLRHVFEVANHSCKLLKITVLGLITHAPLTAEWATPVMNSQNNGYPRFDNNYYYVQYTIVLCFYIICYHMVYDLEANLFIHDGICTMKCIFGVRGLDGYSSLKPSRKSSIIIAT